MKLKIYTREGWYIVHVGRSYSKFRTLAETCNYITRTLEEWRNWQ